VKPTLDFSILDEKPRAATFTDASKQTGHYEVTPAARNASQTTQGAIQGIKQFKRDIYQGIKNGADPYPLLLTAIQGIATATNDREFYTVCRDVMQGAGMFEQIPSEWEREAAETSLLKLETAARNIAAAIVAHKKYLDGQLTEAEPEAGDEYDRRIKKCFGAAYCFLDENKHARTDEDWGRIVGSLAQYTDPLMVELITASINELEREYKEGTEPPTTK